MAQVVSELVDTAHSFVDTAQSFVNTTQSFFTPAPPPGLEEVKLLLDDKTSVKNKQIGMKRLIAVNFFNFIYF